MGGWVTHMCLIREEESRGGRAKGGLEVLGSPKSRPGSSFLAPLEVKT